MPRLSLSLTRAERRFKPWEWSLCLGERLYWGWSQSRLEALRDALKRAWRESCA